MLMLTTAQRLLNPRRSLAARLAWAIVGSSLLLSLLIGLLLGRAAESSAESDAGALRAEYARQLLTQLNDDIAVRLQNLKIAAALIDTQQPDPNAKRELLNQIQTVYPEYAWLGLADLNGKITVAAQRMLEGADVSAHPWFMNGKTSPALGDAHEAALLAQSLLLNPNGEPARFLDVTAPVKNVQGQVVGVLGAHLSWSWVQAIEQKALAPLRLQHQVQAVILSKDGHVILGPTDLMSTQVPADLLQSYLSAKNYSTARWPDGRVYLNGIAQATGQDALGQLGWTVLVREQAGDAFASADQLVWRYVLVGAGAGMVFAALAIWLLQRLTQPLDAIAAAADRIQQNAISQTTEIPLFAGQDEVARLSHTLNGLVHSLRGHNRDLQALNATLEDRVQKRTREVERLGEENKQAAIARERLRMARDLHDTLAHTLAGLLTQIRLTHKVALRNPSAVAEELARAEQVAQQGLQEARAAITNLRANPVREFGLAVAVEQRLTALMQQKDIRTIYDVIGPLPALVDARCETLYRVFEEIIYNIEKHAQASLVRVAMQITEDMFTLTVCDDGVGFDTSRPIEGHYGMRGMQEQCELIGAKLDVQSRLGQGTVLWVTMPV